MIKYIRLNHTEKLMGFIVSLLTSLIAIIVYLNTGRISGERSRLAIRTYYDIDWQYCSTEFYF